ncbi:MAG: arylamine N-acetyltransferase [Haloarculaceae archaeon]
MDAGDYLDRIGVDSEGVAVDRESLQRIQRAHVEAVPFENLAIVGDPFAEGDGEGVTLDPDALYEKVVTRERGGYCFELNGLFNGLLRAVGFDADRVAACVLEEDGSVRTPANHHTNIVDLDRRYLVDVGLAVPPLRRPLPLDGAVRTDRAGVDWRVVDSDRPDADRMTQFRKPGGEWTDRYVFQERPRDLSYFQASCDHLSTAPESPFTGDPVVTVGTADGYKKLDRETLTVYRGGTETEQEVLKAEWYETLAAEFGLRVGGAE